MLAHPRVCVTYTNLPCANERKKNKKKDFFFFENSVNDKNSLCWNAKRFSLTPTLFFTDFWVCVCVCVYLFVRSRSRFIYFFWSLRFEWWMRNFVRKQISKWEMKTKYLALHRCALRYVMLCSIQWIWMWSENDHQSRYKNGTFYSFHMLSLCEQRNVM